MATVLLGIAPVLAPDVVSFATKFARENVQSISMGSVFVILAHHLLDVGENGEYCVNRFCST
jgi:hypothetical protein